MSNYLAQFDWPRTIWKQDLYSEKSNEQESHNFFFVLISKMSYLPIFFFQCKYVLKGIIRNEF